MDWTFFLGDLNYRAGAEDDDENDEAKNDEPLTDSFVDFSRDELSIEMASEQIFCGGWVAPIPRFPPTFKASRN